MNQSTNYFPALTGVRACAAYVMFLTHFNPFSKFGWPWQLAHEGNSGVTVFFVLSGFLIAYRYAERITVSRQWLATYVRNRVARTCPLYFLLTVLTFAFSGMDPVYDLAELWPGYVASAKAVVMALNFTLTRAFFEDFKFTGILQGWTLTAEECFYFLAPVLLLGVVRTRHRWALLLAYGVALLGIGCALVVWAPHRFGFFASYNFLLTYTFFGRCGEFLCGMALAFFVRRRADRVATLRPAYYTWVGLAWMALCVIGGAVANPTPESPVAYSPAGLVSNWGGLTNPHRVGTWFESGSRSDWGRGSRAPNAGATSTVLYDIDPTTRKLYRQDPPNAGSLVEIGSLRLNFTGTEGGFDIAGTGDQGMGIFPIDGASSLFTVDLRSGYARVQARYTKTYTAIALPIQAASSSSY